MSKTNLEKVKYFDPKGLRKLAEEHRALFKVRVTETGEDYTGAKFKAYSEGYTKLINAKFQKKDGSRLARYREATVGGKTTDPKFRLSGKTMSNFLVRKVKTDSWTVGWKGEPAAIVQGNKDASPSRDIIKDLPPKEWNYIIKGLGKLVDKEWKKIPNVIVIKA